jgi:hypothetical protein
MQPVDSHHIILQINTNYAPIKIILNWEVYAIIKLLHSKIYSSALSVYKIHLLTMTTSNHSIYKRPNLQEKTNN